MKTVGAGGAGLRAQVLEHHADYISVCAAAAHSCAVRSGGQLYCWGYNGNNRAVIPEAYSGVKWQAVRCKVRQRPSHETSRFNFAKIHQISNRFRPS